MAGEIGKLTRLDTNAAQRVQQPQPGQHAHCMRQHVDADPERLERRGGFEHAARNACAMQTERQAEPANATADDQNPINRDIPL